MTRRIYDKTNTIIVDARSFNHIKHSLIASGYNRSIFPPSNTNRKNTMLLSMGWMIYSSRNTHELYCIKNGQPCIYRWQTSTVDDGGAHDIEGHDAFQIIANQFKKRNGISISSAFGSDNRLTRRIKYCVPSPINYPPKDFDQPLKTFNNISKSDVSSAYAFEASKDLPTLEGSRILNGYVKPTKDFPFVFYLKSGHMAIYHELDTRKWDSIKDKYGLRYYTYDPIVNDYQHPSQLRLRHPDVSEEEEESLMCKLSPYSLSPEMNALYDDRKFHPERNKRIMNLCIGYFQANARPFLCHISAVVLARCVQRMLDYAIYLERTGKIVRLINTDSIAWQGPQDFNITTMTKSLGSFTFEAENAKLIVVGAKTYQLLKTDGQLITRWSGVKKEWTQELHFGDILSKSPPKSALNIVVWDSQKEEFIIEEEENG